MTRLKIAFLSPFDSQSRKPWSGTLYYMARALDKHCGNVVHLGPARSALEQVGEMRNRISRRFSGKQISYGHWRAIAWDYQRIFQERLRRAGPVDFIFAPAAATQIAFLETSVPIIYTSDATFQIMRGYYSGMAAMSEKAAAAANEFERRAITKAAAAVYPSEWAAQSALQHYGAEQNKIFRVPYGANLETIPDPIDVLESKDLERCALLFLGVDWDRKGGAIAYRATSLLRDRGIDATLTVCGCTPPETVRSEWLRVIPRLDKENDAQRGELSRLLLRANFLLLPTRSECFGIVFCEASAHGTPSIATRTGGVDGAVAEGRSGFLLSYDANAEAYADAIQSLWVDRDGYRQLVRTTREHFDSTVNWDRWGMELNKIMVELRSGSA